MTGENKEPHKQPFKGVSTPENLTECRLKYFGQQICPMTCWKMPSRLLKMRWTSMTSRKMELR